MLLLYKVLGLPQPCNLINTDQNNEHGFYTQDNLQKKKKKNLFVKFTTITITTEKKDTLTGCQGGYTPINAGCP